MPSTTRRRFLRCLGAVGCVGAAGCNGLRPSSSDAVATAPSAATLPDWPTERGDPRRSGVASGAGPADGPGRAWEFELERAPSGSISPPVVHDGAAYLADLFDGVLYRLTAAGEVEWRVDLSTQRTCPPAVADDRVLVGDGASLRAFAPAGVPVWQTDVDDGVVGLAPAGESVVATTPKGVVAVDAADGSPRWAIDTGLVETPPAVGDGLVFVGDTDTTVHAVELDTGERRWRRSLRAHWIQASPVVDEGAGNRVVYVGTGRRRLDGGALYALRAADGEQVWRRELDHSIYHPPAVGDGELFLSTFDGVLRAIDTNDGTDYWSYSPADADADGAGFHVAFAPTLADGTVYVVGPDRGLRALSAREPSTGPLGDVRPAWTFGGLDTERRFLASPVVAGDHLFTVEGHRLVLLGPAREA